MAIVTRAVSKTKFETNDVPTEGQFGDFHDSFQHVNDYVRELSFTSAGTFTVPENRDLEKIYILSNSAGQTIKFGTGGAGTEDVILERTMALNEEKRFGVSVLALTAAKTVYVTATDITIWVHETPIKPLT